jgi:excisionase family DNA binding protein
MSELLTTQQLQDLIRVDRSTIYRMAEDGRLPAVKVGRQWRFPADAIAGRLGLGGGTPGSGHVGLDDLVDRRTLQMVADLAADLLGTMVIVTDLAGTPLTQVANPCGLFRAIAGRQGVIERCVEGWAALAAEPDLDARLRPSHLGFLCARTFVRVDDRLVGMVIAGGIRPDAWPPVDDHLEAMATSLGVDIDLLRRHIEEVTTLDAAATAAIPHRLPRFGELLSRLATTADTGSPASPDWSTS